MPRLAPVAAGAAGLLLAGLIAPVGATALANSGPRTVSAPVATGQWSALGGGLGGSNCTIFLPCVNALAMWDDTIVAGGLLEHSLVAGTGGPAVALNGVAAYSPSDDTWVALGPAVAPGFSKPPGAAEVWAIAVWDDSLVVGGDFSATSDGSVILNNLAVYRTLDDTWLPFGQDDTPGVNQRVTSIITWRDDTLLVAGDFNEAGPPSQTPGSMPPVVQYATRQGAPVQLVPLARAGGLNQPSPVLGTRDDTIYVGGNMSTSSYGVSHIGAVSTSDDTLVPLGPGLDSLVFTIDWLDDLLIAGGGFTATAGGGPPLRLIGGYSLQSNTWAPLGAGLSRDDFSPAQVNDIVSDTTRGLVYAAGTFTTSPSSPPISLNGVGAWDAGISEWIPFAFGPNRNGLDAPFQAATSLLLDDTLIYVGGRFDDTGTGVTGTNDIARWTWDPPQGANALSAAGGATVTITGAGFIGMSPTDTVRFGSTPVTSLTRISSTQLRVVVPPGTFMNAPIYVDAVGGRGQVGTFSTPSGPGPGPTPLNPPAAPLSVAAVAGDARATVTWTAPTSSGSVPITRYEVRSTPAGGTCLVATLTCTITGLTNGTTYVFEARALNGAGWGPWSTPSNTVTPVAPPPPSITITGSRGTGADRQVVFVTGTSTGLDAQQVRAHVKLRGQANYRPGRFVAIGTDGTFTWQRTTGKKTYIYFTGSGVQSNRIIIQAARR